MSLVQAVREASARAIVSRALFPFQFELAKVFCGSPSLEVRVSRGCPCVRCSSCHAKFCVHLLREDTSGISKFSTPPAKGVDVFAPYDPALFVQEAGSDHVILLNKFPHFDLSLLVVTRKFAHQQKNLNHRNLTAMCRVFQQLDGFAFYNCGEAAGFR
jgi:hypothetical protein